MDFVCYHALSHFGDFAHVKQIHTKYIHTSTSAYCNCCMHHMGIVCCAQGRLSETPQQWHTIPESWHISSQQQECRKNLDV